MKIYKRLFQLALVSSMMLSINPSTALAQGTQDADWPCEQVLVPVVPAAVVWAGPPVDGLGNVWQEVDRVNTLVQRITAPQYDQRLADKEIEEFASLQDPAEKDRMLTLLFAGVLDVFNSERSRMLSGILHYSRGQSARANSLGENLDEIVRLEDDPSESARKKLTALHKQLQVQQRLFDEREEFIMHLCSRPVAVEQRLGLFARNIAAYLD